MSTEPMPIFILAAFAIVFPLFWCAVVFFVARLSGWAELASYYTALGDCAGPRRRFQTLWMRWSSHYGNCITLGGDLTGFSMVPMVIFRAGHPALLIPWDEIEVRPHRGFFFGGSLVELRFRRAPEIPVRLNAETYRAIEREARGIST